MTNTIYIKRLTFAVIALILVVFVAAPWLREMLGMFAIGWVIPSLAEYLFPNKE